MVPGRRFWSVPAPVKRRCRSSNNFAQTHTAVWPHSGPPAAALPRPVESVVQFGSGLLVPACVST
jgi:hypothetical protein